MAQARIVESMRLLCSGFEDGQDADLADELLVGFEQGVSRHIALWFGLMLSLPRLNQLPALRD